MRVDKYLWSIRVFKTRTQATEACKKSKIQILNQAVKPSREVKIDEIIFVRKEALYYQYKVLDLPKSRVGAKLVEDYALDVTPESELKKLEMIRMGQKLLSTTKRKFKGRPTKKERRDRDKFLEE